MSLLLAAIVACAPASERGSHPLDDLLRVGDGQALGTHNSYHVAPDPPSVAEWDYTHAPLPVQVGQQGVRQLELDLYRDVDAGAFQVLHVPVVDDGTTCTWFTECLFKLRLWSDLNPLHHPIMVMIEPKAEFWDVPLDAEMLDAIDADVRAVWPEERLLTPDLVQGDHPTLAQAVRDEGWPLLGDARGMLFFLLLDGGEGRDIYTDQGTSVAGRVMFPNVSLDSPLSAVATMDDPESAFAEIQDAVAQGVLVRTRGDAGGVEDLDATRDRLDAALASGAQFISTDFPAAVEGTEHVAEVPDGTPLRCNPVRAPDACTSTALEDPALVGP